MFRSSCPSAHLQDRHGCSCTFVCILSSSIHAEAPASMQVQDVVQYIRAALPTTCLATFSAMPSGSCMATSKEQRQHLSQPILQLPTRHPAWTVPPNRYSFPFPSILCSSLADLNLPQRLSMHGIIAQGALYECIHV